MKVTTLLLALCISASAHAGELSTAQQYDTLRVSSTATTHVRFASELKYVDIASRSLVAKLVEGSKDILALKAREAFDFVTTISCLESSGAMHTFLVTYDPAPRCLVVDTRNFSLSGEKDTEGLPNGGASDPSDLEEIMAKPKTLHHLGTREYDIGMYCDNIIIKDDITYMVFSVQNNSSVSYRFSQPRFAIEATRPAKRKLSYEKQIHPKIYKGDFSIPAGGEGKILFAFDKITLIKGQTFRAYFYESGGNRNFKVEFRGMDLRLL